jgi:ABC-type multidrug transport system ATPase subunit
MIVTHELTKRYGQVTAVDRLDLNVDDGDIYGFLGANGSGKTTTVRVLLGLVLATSGEIEIFGKPMPRSARTVLPHVGSLIEAPAAYGHLSGRANLALLDSMGPEGSRHTRRRRIDEVLERVGIANVGRRPVKAYSLGMKQRLGLAAALIRSPRLLVLDEPTNGLDPQGIHEIRELLLELHAQGTTIFLSSHLLAEVEQLCTRVGVLDNGRLRVQQDLAALQAPTGRVVVVSPDVDQIAGLLDGQVVERAGDRLVVRAPDAGELTARLVNAGARVLELGPERRTLEQVVLEVTSTATARERGTR